MQLRDCNIAERAERRGLDAALNALDAALDGLINTVEADALEQAMGPVLPRLAPAQQAGFVTTEQVQIVARAMQKLSRPELDPDHVTAAEQQLVQQAQQLGPKDLRLIADRIVDAVDSDSPAPVDEQLQQDRRKHPPDIG
jgi:DNA-binding MurR/RpiR family transcriptional regulator